MPIHCVLLPLCSPDGLLPPPELDKTSALSFLHLPLLERPESHQLGFRGYENRSWSCFPGHGCAVTTPPPANPCYSRLCSPCFHLGDGVHSPAGQQQEREEERIQENTPSSPGQKSDSNCGRSPNVTEETTARVESVVLLTAQNFPMLTSSGHPRSPIPLTCHVSPKLISPLQNSSPLPAGRDSRRGFAHRSLTLFTGMSVWPFETGDRKCLHHGNRPTDRSTLPTIFF